MTLERVDQPDSAILLISSSARPPSRSLRRTMNIAGRTISSLIHTQGISDLFRIYLTSQRDGVDFNLAYIPPTFKAPRREDFDTNPDAITAGQCPFPKAVLQSR